MDNPSCNTFLIVCRSIAYDYVKKTHLAQSYEQWRRGPE